MRRRRLAPKGVYFTCNLLGFYQGPLFTAYLLLALFLTMQITYQWRGGGVLAPVRDKTHDVGSVLVQQQSEGKWGSLRGSF